MSTAADSSFAAPPRVPRDRAFRRGSGAARAASRPRRELWLGLLVAVLAGLAGWLSTAAINGLPWQHPYLLRIVLPPGAPVLHPGDDVRIAGERVGEVNGIELGASTHRGAANRAVAVLSLGARRVGAGAQARVRPRGLAGAVYVELLPGHLSTPLPSGSTISAAGSVQLTDVVAGFDRTARRALAQTLTGYGNGLVGAGPGLGRLLSRAPRLLSDAAPVLRSLTPAPGALRSTISGAHAVAGALAATGALPQVISEARAVLTTTAARSSQIAGVLHALPGLEAQSAAVLPGATELITELGRAASELQPGVDSLSGALPSVLALERDQGGIGGFAAVAARVLPVLARLGPVLARAAGPAAGLTPLSTPFAAIAATLLPYRTELRQAPLGFTRWGNFTYDFGTASGHRAVRFSMIMTCAHARDPYPAPGAAARERKPCP